MLSSSSLLQNIQRRRYWSGPLWSVKSYYKAVTYEWLRCEDTTWPGASLCRTCDQAPRARGSTSSRTILSKYSRWSKKMGISWSSYNRSPPAAWRVVFIWAWFEGRVRLILLSVFIFLLIKFLWKWYRRSNRKMSCPPDGEYYAHHLWAQVKILWENPEPQIVRRFWILHTVYSLWHSSSND